MQPRRFLLLADNPLTLAQLRAEIEDLGEETRCQTALTAEEALFRLSQESVDAVLLLPCPAADCLTPLPPRRPYPPRPGRRWPSARRCPPRR